METFCFFVLFYKVNFMMTLLLRCVLILVHSQRFYRSTVMFVSQSPGIVQHCQNHCVNKVIQPYTYVLPFMHFNQFNRSCSVQISDKMNSNKVPQ